MERQEELREFLRDRRRGGWGGGGGGKWIMYEA